MLLRQIAVHLRIKFKRTWKGGRKEESEGGRKEQMKERERKIQQKKTIVCSKCNTPQKKKSIPSELEFKL